MNGLNEIDEHHYFELVWAVPRLSAADLVSLHGAQFGRVKGFARFSSLAASLL